MYVVMEMESCVPSFNFNNVWYLIYNKKIVFMSWAAEKVHRRMKKYDCFYVYFVGN